LEYEFLVIWQFRVRPGMEPTFASIYGPQGDWVALFKTATGFVRTDLNRSETDPRIYLTLDYWTSAEAYDRFRNQHSAEYKAIDAECESLTESETELGRFTPVALGAVPHPSREQSDAET
jgi:heme-degrading monooxygenase HmoA